MLRDARQQLILWSDNRFQLRRYDSSDDSPPLLALSLQSTCLTEAGYDRLRQELEIAKDFDPSWAVVPLRLLETHGRPFLVLTDPGGYVLPEELGRALELQHCLQLAGAIAAALG